MDKEKTLNILKSYVLFKKKPNNNNLDRLLGDAYCLNYSLNQIKSLLKYDKIKRYPTKEDYKEIVSHWKTLIKSWA